MGDTSKDDDVDARGLFRYSNTPNEPTILIAGTPKANDYSMDFSKTGICYIFNNKEFDKHTNLNVRNGTDSDAARLYCRFRELGFDVFLHKDFSVKEIVNLLQEVGKQDHSESSCFVCCILSHGDDGILFGKDGKYSTEKVFAPFRGDVCPTLAGKPKLFFIQACQGDKLDEGVPVKFKEATDSDQNMKIPTHADFLVVYSTVPGFYSWRNTSQGSWFIQALCTVLQKYWKVMDLLQMMTIVNRLVAYEFESCTPFDRKMHSKKQVPFVTSTLTRNVIFPKML